MENQLHQNHFKHLQSLQTQAKLSANMLKNTNWNEQEKEAISQGKAITEMMFDEGMKVFMR